MKKFLVFVHLIALMTLETLIETIKGIRDTMVIVYIVGIFSMFSIILSVNGVTRFSCILGSIIGTVMLIVFNCFIHSVMTIVEDNKT